MPVLLIEGCDLAGKTYAINKIGKFFNSGFTIKNNYKPKFSVESPVLIEHYKKIIRLIELFQKKAPKEIVLLDRFYISQQVYSILRGVDELWSPELTKIERLCLRKLDITLLYLDTPLTLLEKRYRERGDEHISFNQIQMIKERYDLAILFSKLPMIRLDTLNPGWLKKVQSVLK